MVNLLSAAKRRRAASGFTLVELLVVMSIIALLLALAAPRYFKSITRAEEAVLRENLTLVRDALDKYYADTGKYPPDLEELVKKRYLRKVPEDPITGSTATWILVPPDNPEKGGVYDIHSGAPGNSLSGTPYVEW
ncbi:MAG TPA: prepilin-type N-terminal cleavage/methylation domain-containing protein [Burkholderiales bacterium]|nr:prepilin-type N-terminal cleavage/methylation domain-containing protein [Burkholderiales bacterium]